MNNNNSYRAVILKNTPACEFTCSHASSIGVAMSNAYPVLGGMAFALYHGTVTVEIRRYRGDKLMALESRTQFVMGGGQFTQVSKAEVP